jgi:hypothetical protein
MDLMKLLKARAMEQGAKNGSYSRNWSRWSRNFDIYKK